MADLKLALLLNAVSPAIGGVLVRGEKGTAKSTMVRGLAALLPPVPVVPGCPYSCDPAAPDPACPAGPHGAAPPELRPVTLAELPVGATEDRLTGSLDIERVLTAGTTAFQPGLLAAAHRGVLYVDEVNLLHDHLVDLLLDAAALGVNYVEREGVSVRHASRFLLVGTMNPEEGELRPQLLDRFGLTVQVTASQDGAERAEVVRRRLAFEADPAGFITRFSADTATLAAQVAAARDRLPGVDLPDAALRQICAVCGSFGVDGMRADLVTARTAIALAAWHGRDVVTEEDIRIAARLALPHRRRRDPFDAPGLDEQALDEALREASSEPDPGPEPPGPRSPEDPDAARTARTAARTAARTTVPAAPAVPAASRTPARPSQTQQTQQPADTPPSAPVPPAAPFRARLLTVPGVGEGAPGRRSAARGPFGRTVGARLPQDRSFALHLPATVRAAALRGPGGPPPSGPLPPPAAPPPSSDRPRPTCARRYARAVRETWCSSPWTPAGRWRPGSGCARSRARSCPCCSTPTSAGTRWAWSRSAAPGPSSRCRPPPRWRPPPAGWPAWPPAAGPRWPRAWPGRLASWPPNACAIPAAAPCSSWSPTAAPPAAATPTWPGPWPC